jgi:hypothetical protein
MERTKCLLDREERPPFYKEEGAAGTRGATAPSPFSLLHGGGNPIHQVGIPLSYFPF